MNTQRVKSALEQVQAAKRRLERAEKHIVSGGVPADMRSVFIAIDVLEARLKILKK